MPFNPWKLYLRALYGLSRALPEPDCLRAAAIGVNPDAMIRVSRIVGVGFQGERWIYRQTKSFVAGREGRLVSESCTLGGCMA